MARKALYTSIDTTGPFFRDDPARTFRSNARSMLRQMALQGEADIKGQLAVSESSRAVISNKVKPPRVRAHVTAGIPFTLGGKQRLNGAIQVNVFVPNFGFTKKEGTALMAAYSRVERQTGAFARTTRRLRSSKKVNVEELLKGIA